MTETWATKISWDFLTFYFSLKWDKTTQSNIDDIKMTYNVPLLKSKLGFAKNT